MRQAICIGINYPGAEYELRGCVNDAKDWGELFSANRFQVDYLLDKHATKKKIVASIVNLIATLQPSDTGIITYSGHGTWVPDKDGDEPDGRDEAICPIDMDDDGDNLIIDDEFHAMFNKIRSGAKVLFITDSCHSGTVFRFMAPSHGMKRRVRFIPPSHFLKSTELVEQMNRAFGQPSVKASNAPLPGVIHFSGCKDNEFSNDAEFDKPNGAMTYFAIRAFKQVLAKNGTYHDAWQLLRKQLPNWEFQQTPLLNAVPALKATKVFG